MSGDPTPHPKLPKAAPLSEGSQPLADRLRKRPWPLVDVLVAKTRTCPLCDEAVELLERHRTGLGLSVRTADITDDPDLMDAYGMEVPVVFVAGRKRFFGQVDPVLLERTVHGARQSSS